MRDISKRIRKIEDVLIQHNKKSHMVIIDETEAKNGTLRIDDEDIDLKGRTIDQAIKDYETENKIILPKGYLSRVVICDLSESI